MAVASFVEDTFSQVVQTKLFQKSQIDITVQIFQVDGGVLSACINATTLALIDAGIPMLDFLTSCTVGYLDQTILLDLTHQEEIAGGPELAVCVLPKLSKILTMKMVSSSTRVNMSLLEELLDHAKIGAQQIHKILDAKVREQINNIDMTVRSGDTQEAV